MAKDVSRSWFAVFNNPAEHGYEGEPKEVLEKLRDEWLSDEHPQRTGAWLYCVSAEGLHHVHMVLEDAVPMRFSAIKKSYCKGMHFEPTKGNKAQVTEYINKEGKFAEKGEKIIEKLFHGDIQGRAEKSSRHSPYDDIAVMLKAGMTPREILSTDLRFYKYEGLIKRAYLDKRDRETPPRKEITVYWHVGLSGSGKSFTYLQLCEKYGEDRIFFTNNYANNGTATFDGYANSAAPILFLDEYKGQLPYSLLLSVLGDIKCQIHCRYASCLNLWNEVHITSVYHPFDIYKMMVPTDYQKIDTFRQLQRRIHYLVYHCKINGLFFSYQQPFDDFISMENTHQLAVDSYNFSKESGFEITSIVPLKQPSTAPILKGGEKDARREKKV